MNRTQYVLIGGLWPVWVAILVFGINVTFCRLLPINGNLYPSYCFDPSTYSLLSKK